MYRIISQNAESFHLPPNEHECNRENSYKNFKNSSFCFFSYFGFWDFSLFRISAFRILNFGILNFRVFGFTKFRLIQHFDFGTLIGTRKIKITKVLLE